MRRGVVGDYSLAMCRTPARSCTLCGRTCVEDRGSSAMTWGKDWGSCNDSNARGLGSITRPKVLAISPPRAHVQSLHSPSSVCVRGEYRGLHAPLVQVTSAREGYLQKRVNNRTAPHPHSFQHKTTPRATFNLLFLRHISLQQHHLPPPPTAGWPR